MRRMAFAVLTVATALFTGLLTASVAGAQTPAATIDAVDFPGPSFQPPNVTISTGETVRWEFDQALSTHTLTSSSANWTIDETRNPGGASIDRTFGEAGLYNFLCRIHGAMNGSVTVQDEPPADPLENVLVFSKTAGFRHTSIDEGIAAIQALGAANDFAVTATEDGAAFTDANLAQFDAVVWLSTTGDVLTDDQQDAFERYIQAGGGYVGIHAAADTEYTWGWYGQMVGGYFKNHPPGTPTASVDIEDTDEPSTEGLPVRWPRTDEWYNYQSPDNPSVGGGGADYSPRNSGVKVLATVDETTYDEQDDSAGADDHPIAWCGEFDGGKVWYTGLGHTEESFGTAPGNIRSHILGGLQTVTGAEESDCGEPRQAEPEAEDFEKVTLDDDTQNPFELDVAEDGRVFYIERDGRLFVLNPETGQKTLALQIPVDQAQENGLMGLQLAPDFATSQWVYLTYSEVDNATRQDTQVVARYRMQGNTADPLSRQEIITWVAQRDQCCHSSGSLYFGPDGSLYISTGDNTNPFDSDGFTPIDERPGRQPWDAQRTSANTNDLNGKILRIVPNPDTPGYTIPAGNLFAPGTAQTRPEIFAMGFRNPFRFTVDPETSWVLVGDYGPDAPQTVAGRGPQGSVEFNTVTQAGNYGWPYCVRDNTPYNDYTFRNGPSGPLFNCAAPVNNSPNNTGLTNLPPAIGADAWMGYSELDPRHVPDLGGGGAPTGGPRYHYDPDGPPTKFPEFYDDLWFNGEWNNGWIKTFELGPNGAVTDVEPFALGTGYLRPMDLDFGPDGSLYVIEWGSGFGGNNADSGIYRIDYVAEGRRPIAHAAATPDNGPVPLQVQFSSAGSVDPDGTSLTYEWDFDGDGDTDSTVPNPTHTYTTAGNYTATLVVTDQSGQTGSDTVPVTAGNTAPQVTIVIPEEGQFASFGETVPYEITVTDAEDGSTAAGTIDCDDVTLNISLGHDVHAHELSEQQGCEGTFQTETDAGHGSNANIFPVIEAVYTDEGGSGGGAGALTGRDIHQLQPKRKQAEHFTSTGRAAGATGGGDPGVGTENTADEGAGLNIGFIENGDYVSYEPVNLENIRALRFRVASGGAGGTIEVRTGSPTGDLVATTPMIAPTGGWQNWTTVTLPITPPEGTHELFLVFRHPTDQGGLMNLNWFEAVGAGAAVSEAPEVAAAATPETGNAPLTVAFDGTATDADSGPGLTYLWDFGVSGTTEDTSTQEDPTYTYERPGTYMATFTATDVDGAKASATVQVRVTSPDECPVPNVRSDEFEGSQLDTSRWSVIRPDGTRPPTVQGGFLRFPIDNGSLYGPGTSARNIVVQPLPSGDVSVTAKIETEPLVENYQQAGLRVYQDDNNWASVHMIHAGGSRDFEFIYENAGTPRNEGADKLGGIPADSPHEYWVRLISDGSELTAEYSFNGNTFSPVGRVADISGWGNAQIGPVALSDQAPTHPVASFDWIRFDPDVPSGGGGGGGQIVDQFDGSTLGSAWEVERPDQLLTVSGGNLNIPAQPGDLYAGRNDAKNLTLRDMPGGAWEATAKLNFEGTAQYHQAGLIVYGDDSNFTKFGRIAHTVTGDEKFEFIYENAGTPRNEAADSTANIPASFPDDFYVRMTSDGTNVTGAYSTDGASWTPVGRPAPLPANARIGMFAFSNDGTGNPVAAFDSFTLTGDEVGGPAGPSRDDEFDGAALDKDRWNAIVRENPGSYTVAGGALTITTEPGDIYSGDTTPPPNNFILQSADHAGEDWVIETKLSGTINGGYGQGGLLAYSNGDNWVKLNPISDAGQTRINRIELRSEVNGTPVGPEGVPDPQVPVGTTDFWVRLTKAGNSYSGEYSFDGNTWTAMGTVTNAMADPDFGVYAFGPQADGQGDTVAFDYFLLDGRDATDPCECIPTGGDSFDSGALDKTKWNAIVREQEDLYAFNDGWLEIETVNGDIYTGGNPAPTRNFILQEPAAAGQDWVIETHVDAATLSGGYEQAGLMVYADDDNYIKFDIISDDGQTVLNRLELRSEIGGAIQQPQPADPLVPAGETDVWLRLTKTGTSYAGEYSFDGVTYQDVNIPVTNPMVDPAFGIFTLGVNSGGGTARFEYFSLDGSTGCEEPEPENQAPVIEDVAASPQTGFAPLEVDFTVDASDPDEGDTLTYAWDFDGDGDTDSTQEDPTHTYTAAGEYEAEVTVSDGEAERSRTVPVTVFGPDDPQARFRVLVFSKTAGFRHDSIDEGHAAIEQLGADNDFQVDHTEDAAIFNAAALARYDTVVFLSTTGDVLNAAQQTAFENYIEGGGGFTGIHAAADTEYDWKWYGRMIGAYFHSHPPGTPTANVIVEDTDDHTTQGLPLTWTRTDEWYNYKRVDFETDGSDYSPRNSGVHVLLRLDESTYDEQDGNTTDDDHPISWCQRYEGGRSWYTGLGHTAESFGTAPGNIRSHVLGGIEVSAGAADSAECGAANPNAPIVEAFGEPTSGTAPLTVEFSSSALDPNGPGSGLRYRWEFGDDSSALGPNPVHTYTQPGSYEAVLTVTDAEGLQTSRTVEITVNPAGTQAPVVDVAADPGRGVAPLAVQFQAAATDPDGDESKLVYRWNFDDGAGSSFAQNPKHTYMTPGTYDATVTVTDAAGASTTSDPITITVENPPGNVAPNVEAAADPTSGTAPLRVQFTAAATDPDGDHVLISWNFGDQTGGAGAAVAHTYTTPGVYNAVVTVRDQGGLTDTATVQVTVTGAGGSSLPNVAPLGGDTGAGGSPPANLAPQGGDVASETVRVTKRQKVARVIKRGLRYTVACEAACRVTATLRIAGADNQRLGKAAARSIAAGASRDFVLRLDRKVRRNLVSAMRRAKLRNLRATLVLKIRTAEGTSTVRKAVVLRR